MVIIRTRAVEVSIQAVSPESSFGGGGAAAAGAAVCANAPSAIIKPIISAASASSPALEIFFNVMV